MRWLAGVRIRQAPSLLETTAQPVDRVAHEVGFRSVTQFRSMFRRITATTPTAYRAAFS